MKAVDPNTALQLNQKGIDMKLISATIAATLLLTATAFAGPTNQDYGKAHPAAFSEQGLTPVLSSRNESKKDRKVRDRTYVSAANDSR